MVAETIMKVTQRHRQLLLLLLLLANRFTWHLVQKLQGHVTRKDKKTTTCLVDRKRRQQQNSSQPHQYNIANKDVFRCRLKVDSDDADVTDDVPVVSCAGISDRKSAIADHTVTSQAVDSASCR